MGKDKKWGYKEETHHLLTTVDMKSVQDPPTAGSMCWGVKGGGVYR